MHTLHVVREELALHASFFVRVPAGTAAENVGGGTALWHVWYDRLRPLVLQQTELDVLCEDPIPFTTSGLPLANSRRVPQAPPRSPKFAP